jgi:hypothetical protein
MTRRRTWITRLFVAAAAAAGVAVVPTPAAAGLLPVSVSVQPEAGNFRWTYSVVLPSDMKLQAGDYFTIYDFGGYVEGSGSVSSPYPDSSATRFWSFSTSMVGPTPDRLNPQDNPEIPNLTWTYNGPTIPAGQLTLGNFAATSLFQESQVSFFTAQNPRAAGGEIDKNITETLTPTGTTPTPTPGVPEPTTLVLAGLGLPLIGAARRFRNRNK